MTDAENTLRVYDHEAIRPIIGWPQWREDDTARICQLRGRSVFAYDPPPTGQRPSEGWSVAAIYPPYIALCAWRSHLTAWLDEQGISIMPCSDGTFLIDKWGLGDWTGKEWQSKRNQSPKTKCYPDRLTATLAALRAALGKD